MPTENLLTSDARKMVDGTRDLIRRSREILAASYADIPARTAARLPRQPAETLDTCPASDKQSQGRASSG